MRKEENDVIVNPKVKKKAILEPIIGVVFLVWFVGSILGAIYFSEINTYYTAMIFGQAFLVFGMISLINAKGIQKSISVPFILVGLCCIIIPCLMMHPEVLSVTIVWESVMLLLIILGFVMAGVAMVVLPIMHKKRLEKECTVTVSAIIIEYLSTHSENGRLYCPMYSFIYNGKEYKTTTNQYTNLDLKPVGSMVELKINPNDPEVFLDDSKHYTFLIVMGILFLAVSVPILLYILSKYKFVE